MKVINHGLLEKKMETIDLDPCQQFFSEGNIQTFFDEGILVLEHALPMDFIQLLARDSSDLFTAGSFNRSGIGQHQGRHVDEKVRADSISWWDPSTLILVQQRFWRFMENLRLEFNRHMFLGLFDSELHYATYQTGGFYTRHLDQFRQNNQRTVSMVLFLNNDWLETDGGALRLYGDDTIVFRDILPQAGVLALFNSARVLHEVMPTHRLRLTLTGWMRTRLPGALS